MQEVSELHCKFSHINAYQNCLFKILFEIHVIQAHVDVQQLHIERISQKESFDMITRVG